MLKPAFAVDGSSRQPPPAVAIFARAATPGKSKTRLVPLLGARGAAEFQAALISDTLRKVAALTGDPARYLFLAGRVLPDLSAIPDYTVARQRGADLGERLERAFKQLLRRHPAALVLGTDSPTLPPRILRAAFEELRFCDAVLGPCPDGGYYLIGLRRLRVGMFRGIRWGTGFAFRDTLRNLRRCDFSCSVLEPFEDVDRPADVQRLRRAMAQSAAVRRSAPATWRYLKAFWKSRQGSTSRRARRQGQE